MTATHSSSSRRSTTSDFSDHDEEGVVRKTTASTSASSVLFLLRKIWLAGMLALIVAVLIGVCLDDEDPIKEEVDVPAIEDIATSASATAAVLAQIQYDREQQAAGVQVEVDLDPVTESGDGTVQERAVVETEDRADQQTQAADIVAWMMRGGAVFPHIEIVEYSAEYRGIHATADVAAGDVLAEIPDQFIITFDKARASEIGQRIIAAMPEHDDPELSHYLISMFLVVEYDLGPASWWWPYLVTLPRHFHNMPSHYSPEEAQLAVESRLDSILGDKFQQDWDEICGVLPDFCQQHSVETYRWARLVLRSRAFSLERDGTDQTALQPFVDMINHDFNNGASWRYRQESRRGQIYAKRPIKAGEIVTISYGAKSNRVLLRTYGFALQDNPYYESPLYIQLPDGEASSGMLARRVAKSGNPSTEFYRILHTMTLSTSDDDFKAGMKLCRISVATSDELDAFDDFAVPVSLRNEAAALRYLQETIDSALYKYPTTVDDDDELLKDTTLSENARNIIITRKSEKVTLLRMNEIIDDLLELVHTNVDQKTFNKRRYHQKYADHKAYIQLLVDLRRAARLSK